MALNYSVSLRPNPLEREASPKAYATAQMNGELSLKQLSRRVSSQTTVSRADVVAVLTATVDNLAGSLAHPARKIELRKAQIGGRSRLDAREGDGRGDCPAGNIAQ